MEKKRDSKRERKERNVRERIIMEKKPYGERERCLKGR
jgi:hypothetical protein